MEFVLPQQVDQQLGKMRAMIYPTVHIVSRLAPIALT
jgi:hypothetical protein